MNLPKTLLHLHSNYSLGFGAADIESLVYSAKKLGYESVALTDINNLYILFYFLEVAQSVGIKPIIGAHLIDRSGREVTVYVRSTVGFGHLTQLISAMKESPDADLRILLPTLSEGLSISTASIDFAEFLKMEGGISDVWLEVHSFHIPILKLRRARQSGILPLAAHPVYLHQPEDFQKHLILRAIAENKTLSQLQSAGSIHPKTYLISPKAFSEAFQIIPEAIEYANSLADSIDWIYPTGQQFKPRYIGPQGVSAFEHLRQLSYEGAARRYGTLSQEITDRIERELIIISAKGFAEYFLTVYHIVQKSSAHCGRGSAAASIISYCLGITEVDPIRHHLFFERFLNMRRDDPPDIDVDFCWDERDDILDHVFQLYGTDYAAMVSNHVLFKERMAVREVAKVYGIPEMEIQAFFKKIPGMNYYMATRAISTYYQQHPDPELGNIWQNILKYAFGIAGYPRYLSVHCGGFVVTTRPIREHAPLEPAPKGVPILQWEKDQTEDSGLIKIDILGNRSLSVIRDTKHAVWLHEKRKIDFNQLDIFSDPATVDTIANGKTMGVFYVESPAMRQLQQKTRRGDFDHLTIHSSIIRPAANKHINEYVRRLRGGAYEPLHPLLEEQLNETYGIMCYQEDVIKAGMTLADMDEYDATKLLKSLSRKNDNELKIRYRKMFTDGCNRKGLSEEKTQEIWEMIHSFAGYSFCKPHSASYVVVSFQSAWLKTHYPAEFMAAVISNQGGYYSAFGYVSEARRLGIHLLLPDINHSKYEYVGVTHTPNSSEIFDRELQFLLKENGIQPNSEKKLSKTRPDAPQDKRLPFPNLRVGLMQIKQLTTALVGKIMGERTQRGFFTSLQNFLDRVSPHQSDAQLLIKAGCFDAIANGATRPEMMWQCELYYSRLQHHQHHTFDLFERELPLAIPQTPNYSFKKVIEDEIEVLDFLLSVHPLFLYQEIIKKIPHIKASDMHQHIGKKVTMIGWMITHKVVYTKHEEMMDFVSFEDTTAIYETVFFPEAYQKFCTLLSYVKPYRLTGTILESYSSLTLQVEYVSFLEHQS